MALLLDAPVGLRGVATALHRARGDERAVRAVFDQSPHPMVMLDGGRRYLDANGPARLLFRMGLAELRSRVVDDLTPAPLSDLDADWDHFMTAGRVTGTYDTQTPDGAHLEVRYWALVNALPGVHVGIFAPAHWGDDELEEAEWPADDDIALTPREVEVIGMAARGLSGPQIARELVLSPETVKNHFTHIRTKLEAPNRAAAVARALQLGLID